MASNKNSCHKPVSLVIMDHLVKKCQSDRLTQAFPLYSWPDGPGLVPTSSSRLDVVYASATIYSVNVNIR